jgi:selenocysteine lyase/cysteine desulfurase
MQELDLNFVRQQFPAFSESDLQGTVFMENAGGAYMAKQVIERFNDYFVRCKVQPYYPNPVSMEAGNRMDEAYSSLSHWLNTSPEHLYFGPSTSQNTYVLANAVQDWLVAGDEIIVTNQDHEANTGVWRKLQSKGISVIEWGIDPLTGKLELEALTSLVSEKTKLLTFPHCSNIVGDVNPVKEICAFAKENGIRTIVDGVSFAGHGLPDVSAMGVDAYLFSLYKVYGPHLGCMVISPDFSQHLSNQSHYFNEAVREKRLMPAGPDHAQIAAVKGVSDYFSAIYRHHFGEADLAKMEPEKLRSLLHNAEEKLVKKLLSYFESKSNIQVIGPKTHKNRAPTIAVIIENHKPWDIAAALGKQGILVGAGNFYSVRLLEALGIDPQTGVLRLSLVHYSSEADIDRFIDVLDSIIAQ